MTENYSTMNDRGLYECIECVYREYRIEDDGPVAACPRCKGKMKNMSVRAKGWVSINQQ
jgi:predicted nucleic acid-binding Zn ribbon protein